MASQMNCGRSVKLNMIKVKKSKNILVTLQTGRDQTLWNQLKQSCVQTQSTIEEIHQPL